MFKARRKFLSHVVTSLLIFPLVNISDVGKNFFLRRSSIESIVLVNSWVLLESDLRKITDVD